MNAEDYQALIGIALVPGLQEGQGPNAVDAGVGPEVDQHNLAQLALQGKRIAVDPFLGSCQFRSAVSDLAAPFALTGLARCGRCRGWLRHRRRLCSSRNLSGCRLRSWFRGRRFRSRRRLCSSRSFGGRRRRRWFRGRRRLCSSRSFGGRRRRRWFRGRLRLWNSRSFSGRRRRRWFRGRIRGCRRSGSFRSNGGRLRRGSRIIPTACCYQQGQNHDHNQQERSPFGEPNFTQHQLTCSLLLGIIRWLGRTGFAGRRANPPLGQDCSSNPSVRNLNVRDDVQRAAPGMGTESSSRSMTSRGCIRRILAAGESMILCPIMP